MIYDTFGEEVALGDHKVLFDYFVSVRVYYTPVSLTLWQLFCQWRQISSKGMEKGKSLLSMAGGLRFYCFQAKDSVRIMGFRVKCSFPINKNPVYLSFGDDFPERLLMQCLALLRSLTQGSDGSSNLLKFWMFSQFSSLKFDQKNRQGSLVYPCRSDLRVNF